MTVVKTDLDVLTTLLQDATINLVFTANQFLSIECMLPNNLGTVTMMIPEPTEIFVKQDT